MSDFLWCITAVVLLVIVGLIFRIVWYGGEKPNGLKGELQDRVTALERENVTIWQELRRLTNRLTP